MLWATSRWRSTSPRTRLPPPRQAQPQQDQPHQQPQQQRPRQQQQPQRQDRLPIRTSLTTTQGTNTQPSCRLEIGFEKSSNQDWWAKDMMIVTKQAERRFEERHRAKVSKVNSYFLIIIQSLKHWITKCRADLIFFWSHSWVSFIFFWAVLDEDLIKIIIIIIYTITFHGYPCWLKVMVKAVLSIQLLQSPLPTSIVVIIIVIINVIINVIIVIIIVIINVIIVIKIMITIIVSSSY